MKSAGLYILFLFAAMFSSEASGLAGDSAVSHLLFAENKGQWEDPVLFRTDLKGGRLFLERGSLTYALYHPSDVAALHFQNTPGPATIRMHALRLSLKGASKQPDILPCEEAAYHHNYFLGNDPARWATDVRLFRRIRYREMYPGIDLDVYSRASDVKYDFVVAPGADPSQVALQYDGADGLALEDGELVIRTSVGDLKEQRPVAWQERGGERLPVACEFVLKGHVVRFRFPGGYNASLPLVIDPTVIFTSYTGSLADNWGFTATYDAAGNAYAGGNVNTFGYPVTLGAYQLTYGGSGTGGNAWGCDMAIAKFSANGSSLLYATYLGGSDNEQPQSLVVDAANNLFIYGVTYSANFPVTAGAVQGTKNGQGDMVISRLSPNGNTLVASTFLGGSQHDGVNTSAASYANGPIKYNYGDEARGDILLDPAGNVVVASCTQSSNFPVTAGAFQTSFGSGQQDAVVFKLNPSLTTLLWSTFLGGSGMDAAYSCVLDGAGNLYLAGGTTSTDFPVTPGSLHPSYQGGTADGFLVHLSASGSSVINGTFIGTASYDQAFFVQLDGDGNVYTTGQTTGSYPVSPGVYSNPNSGQFIHKLSGDLGTSFFSTVFGSGSPAPNISPTAFLVDTCENLYVSGWGRCITIGTGSGSVSGMPITSNAMQSTTDGCDFYFIVLSRDAQSLLYGSFFGGNQSEEHVDGGTSRFDPNGVIYQSVCAGCGGHSDLPTTPGVVSTTNGSSNCNNAVIKLRFDLSVTRAHLTASPGNGCIPLPVQFGNQSTNGISYVWDFGDGSPRDTTFQPSHTYTSTGTFPVMLISRNNLACNLADTAWLNVTTSPGTPVVASMNAVPSASCDTFSVQVSSTGTGGNLFRWRFGDGGVGSGATAAHTYALPGTYTITLVASDSLCHNADSVSRPVVFRAPVTASIVAGGAASGCAPQTLILSSPSGAASSARWDYGDGSGDTGSAVIHVYPLPGQYAVRLIVSDTASCNQSDTALFQLTVFARPEAGFAVTPLQPYFPGSDILFTDTSLRATIRSWDFGDGTTSAASPVSHRYASGGSYDVCLTATGDGGCADSACKTLEVLLEEAIYVPNSFTPNHDGQNDFFFPVTEGILQLSVRIYDRWGVLIAHWDGLDGRWDGRYKGGMAAQDVYIYRMEAIGSITPNIVKTGRVTLIY